ncbi:MAG: hypothetical protein HQL68_04405 [Magnetococcales bacterium]|nr:hypothetical protein [Magnetococcales bacterium]
MLNKFRLFAMAFLALIFMVAVPKNVLAVSLGEIQVFRTEANMFHGEIPVILTGDEKINKIVVSTGNRTDYAKELGAEFDASVVNDGKQKFLVITGKNPQETPFFTLLVSVDLGGSTLSRNFPVQFDGQITPLPPRKLPVSTISTTTKATSGALSVKTTNVEKSWERYLLWWVVGGVLGVVLFWIWWRKGTISDEDLLIIAREEKAKLPVESWETLLAADEWAEPGAVPKMEQAHSTSKQTSQKSEPDTEAIVKGDQPVNIPQPAPESAPESAPKSAPEPLPQPTQSVPAATQTQSVDKTVAAKGQAVKLPKPTSAPVETATTPQVAAIPKPAIVAPEPTSAPPEVATPKPAPKPAKPTSSGRLSAVIMQGGGAKATPSLVIKKDATNDVKVTDNSGEDLSIEAVMSSLEKMLDDKNKKNPV